MQYDLKDSMGHLLAVSHWKLHQMLVKKFKDSGLGVTPDQWKVLLTLLNSGPIFQSQLAYSMLKDRAGVKRLIDQLEQRKLLIRKATESDGRTFLIELSPKGREVVGKLNALAQENLKEAFDGVDQKELEQTKGVLNQFLAKFEKK